MLGFLRSRSLTRSALILVALPAALASQTSDTTLTWPQSDPGLHRAVGLRFDREARLAFVLAVGINGRSERHGWSGPFIAVEPGLRTLRVSAGAANVLGPSAFTGQLRISALRVWSDGAPVAQGQLFVGQEFRLTLLFASVGFGRFWRVRGDVPGDAAFYSLTYGLGF